MNGLSKGANQATISGYLKDKQKKINLNSFFSCISEKRVVALMTFFLKICANDFWKIKTKIIYKDT